jgi:hypothetical protein
LAIVLKAKDALGEFPCTDRVREQDLASWAVADEVVEAAVHLFLSHLLTFELQLQCNL